MKTICVIGLLLMGFGTAFIPQSVIAQPASLPRASRSVQLGRQKEAGKHPEATVDHGPTTKIDSGVTADRTSIQIGIDTKNPGLKRREMIPNRAATGERSLDLPAPFVDAKREAATTIRVASISFEPIKFDLAGNTKKLTAAFREAEAGDAKLAVAPEGILEGYVVDVIIAKDVEAERMRDVAVAIDSPTITGLQDLAHELNMCLVFGFAEKIKDEIYNCAVFIDNAGSICGKHHKMQFAEGYDANWWFNRLGQHSRAFDTPYGRCGVMICNDRWNPRLAQIPALDGAQFLVIPSYGSTSIKQDEAVLARGVENRLPIIEANVGVRLIVSDNRIVAVDRERRGITFGEITIPQPRTIDAVARDQAEVAFLEWRAEEMPVRLAQRMSQVGKIAPSIVARNESEIDWYDAKDIGVEGKAWKDTVTFFDRLPARAKQRVRPPVWSLSQDSAGMCLRFLTDARSIHARWNLRSENLAMPHMPATGVSGVDLYVRHNGAWRWLATGQPKEKNNTARLVHELPPGKREYLLYLPLYNGVTSVEVGVPHDASLWRQSLKKDRRPLVFWGTSITQGACASRPGMCHPAILGRRFQRPVINLGFSGNGRMEPEVAELVSEIEAAVYVIDCLPNITADTVRQRVRPLVEIIRQRHKTTPILLVEDRTYSNAFLLESKRRRHHTSRAALRAEYEKMRDDGIGDLHYLAGDGLLGLDGEDTVDSSHPTDLGFVRQANAFEAALRPILGELKRPVRWWKGNLHTHSLWSDGNDFPEMIAEWYRRKGYHFLALSDHNVLSQGEKWMKLSAIEGRNATDALPKYLARFGNQWVETRGRREDGTLEVRLKPLAEVRSLVEEPDRFLMIPAEEITDHGVHLNATNIGELIEPQGGDSIRQTIQNNLRAVEEQAKRLGRIIIPHLNHPNLGDKGIAAEELAALVQDRFFEVFNGVDKDGDLGSDRRHSLETLWDITSTLRISEFHAPPMFGLATDDSHHYHGGKNASPGRGWIMLKAERLSPESVVKAMKMGDFYASSGVQLRRVDFDGATKTLHLEIEPDGDATFTTQFVGTPAKFDKTTTPRLDAEGNVVASALDYSDDVGKVFATAKGLSVRYRLTGDELFVRATVTSSRIPENPTSESPFKKAWTQPFGWRAHLE